MLGQCFSCSCMLSVASLRFCEATMKSFLVILIQSCSPQTCVLHAAQITKNAKEQLLLKYCLRHLLVSEFAYLCRVFKYSGTRVNTASTVTAVRRLRSHLCLKFVAHLSSNLKWGELGPWQRKNRHVEFSWQGQ